MLAHLAEMLGYWPAEIDKVLASPTGSIPFGRVATDPGRIGRIGADRVLPAGQLFDRVETGIGAVEGRLDELAGEGAARTGIHPRLGEMTIPAIVERFVVGHLEEHVAQLQELLAARPGGDVAAGG